MWWAPEGGKGNSRNTRNVCPWLPRGQFLYLQGGLPIWGWAGVPSLLSDLLITMGITIQDSESSPTGGQATVPRAEGCARQSRSGQARRRGWFHEAISNPELGQRGGHPHPVWAVMVDRATWRQSRSGDQAQHREKGLNRVWRPKGLPHAACSVQHV